MELEYAPQFLAILQVIQRQETPMVADYGLQNFTDRMVDLQSSIGRLLVLLFIECEVVRRSVMRYVRYFLYFMILVTVL